MYAAARATVLAQLQSRRDVVVQSVEAKGSLIIHASHALSHHYSCSSHIFLPMEWAALWQVGSCHCVQMRSFKSSWRPPVDGGGGFPPGAANVSTIERGVGAPVVGSAGLTSIAMSR